LENRRLEKRCTIPRQRRGADDRLPNPALVHARGFVVPQAGDLVLHMQLATLQVHDRGIVDRRMRHGISQFSLERFVLTLQFRKVRLHGHRASLLCQIPDLNILTEAPRQVTDGFIVRRVKSPQSAHVLNHLLP